MLILSSLLSQVVLLHLVQGQSESANLGPSLEPTSSLSHLLLSTSSSDVIQTIGPTPLPTDSIPTTDDVGSGSQPDIFPLNPSPVPQTLDSNSYFTIAETNLSLDFVGDGLCNCDLLVGQCDALCCCDRDCSADSRIVFNCSSLSSSGVEVCLDIDEVVGTSLSRCSCADSSLLCIIYEQDPSRLEYGAAMIVDNAEDFSTLELLRRTPDNDMLLALQAASYPSEALYYTVGDPLLLVNNDTDLSFELLTIPAPLNGVQCHDSNPITYLINREYTCVQPLEDLSVECASLSARRYFNLSLLQVPNFLSHEDINSNNIPLEISCAAPDQSCLMPTVYDSNTGTCNHSLVQARFTFTHDGSGHLLNASVNLVLGDTEGTSLVQKFVIDFVEQVDLRQLRRSGNPGYRKGEIILAGTLTELGNINITIDQTLWLHIRGSGNECSGERPNVPIRFKQDLFVSCLMRVSLNDFVADCSGARQRAYSNFHIDPVLEYVGRFGNSDPSNVSQWLRIINETMEASSEPSVRSLCTGIPTLLDISILYSNTGEFSDPQPLLSGVRYVYFTQDIVSEHVKSGRLILQTSVKFVDISDEPSQVLPSITGTVLKLPQDFLYPFFVSHAATLSQNIITQLILFVAYNMIIVDQSMGFCLHQLF